MRHSVSLVRRPVDGDAFVDRVRAWEAGGIGGLWVPDHLGTVDPFVPLAAAAVATTSLRLGTLVLNHDFWHPVLLARAAGTLATLAPGRVVLGLGAGHARIEYEALGIEYRRPGPRVAALRTFVDEVQRRLGPDGTELGLATPATPPQLLVGGNGDRVLTIAAEVADLVGLAGFTSGTGQTHSELSHFSWEGLADRMAFVRERRASDRPLEVNVLVQAIAITDDPAAYLRPWLEQVSTPLEDLLDCPFVLVGPVGFVREQLARLAEVGVGDVTVFDDSADAVLEALA